MIVAVLVVVAGPVLAQEELNSRQLEALSPKAANRRAQQDLLSIFDPVKPYHHGMFRYDHGELLTTVAHGTEFEGLCSRDLVTLWYAPVEPGQANMGTPLRPYKVTATTEYSFLKPPQREPVVGALSDNVWQDACAVLGSNDRVDWFSAESPEQAVRGTLLYRAVLVAIKAGTVQPTCDAHSTKPGECAKWIISSEDPDQPPSVDTCGPRVPGLCYILGWGSGLELTVRAERNGDSLTPGKISSVDAVEYIIVT
jgi:hypothetical protein